MAPVLGASSCCSPEWAEEPPRNFLTRKTGREAPSRLFFLTSPLFLKKKKSYEGGKRGEGGKKRKETVTTDEAQRPPPKARGVRKQEVAAPLTSGLALAHSLARGQPRFKRRPAALREGSAFSSLRVRECSDELGGAPPPNRPWFWVSRFQAYSARLRLSLSSGGVRKSSGGELRENPAPPVGSPPPTSFSFRKYSAKFALFFFFFYAISRAFG